MTTAVEDQASGNWAAVQRHRWDALTAPSHTVPAVPWAHVGRRWSSLGAPAVRCETGRCAGRSPMVHTDPAAHTLPECWDSAQAAGWRLDWIGTRTCPSCQEDLAYRSGHTRLDWPPVLYEPGVWWARGRKYFHVTPVTAAPPPAQVAADTVVIEALRITTTTDLPDWADLPDWPTAPDDTPLPDRRWPRFRRTS